MPRRGIIKLIEIFVATIVPRHRGTSFKHLFATRLEAAGVSRSDVVEMLGHATSSVTRRYIAPDISRLLHEAEKVVAMRHEPGLRVVG